MYMKNLLEELCTRNCGDNGANECVGWIRAYINSHSSQLYVVDVVDIVDVVVVAGCTL